MVLTLRAALLLLTLFTAVNRASAASSPKFEDYPAAIEISKKPPRVRISGVQNRQYASQLRRASRDAPDFAGHYVLATWGCGSSCVMAAAIDAKTGEVTRLPFTVSNWPLDITEPLSHRLNSRLLIIRGSRNEKENGTYYYELVGHSFKLLSEESKP